MIRFECDYTEGAHERVLQKLVETNMEQCPGYGVDSHCQNAAEMIKAACEAPNAAVHFLVGGTQTNTTVITSVLRPHQGVVSAVTGHIHAHETGAPESRGHKVLTLPSVDGKISASQVRQYVSEHWNNPDHEHLVQPGMVYVSHPTENGAVYTKPELEELSAACRELRLPLFLDGARLGYALASPGTELTLPDLARLCDVFYIGGTKVGALFGEALVITAPELQKDFRYHIKQHGAMLAKGRLLGVQFEALFENGLYLDISRHAVDLALKLRQAFESAGLELLFDSQTNQQFPIMPDSLIEKLSEKYSFSNWQRIDESRSALRFCTSWAASESAVDELISDLKKNLNIS